MWHFGYLFVLPLLVVGLMGCKQNSTSAQTRPARTVPITLGTRTYQCEIADTPASREQGLMYRKEMPANHGMIFVFEIEQLLSFWMKNTYIPLDIVFINKAGKVVSVKTMKPLDETSVESDGWSLYAVEINAGEAAKAGIQADGTVAIPADLSNKSH
jgi:uncharacterized membrane protein (UPF0127 family)